MLKEKEKTSPRKLKKINYDENEKLMLILDGIKRDMECIHNNFNYATDPELIDSCIYEINSLNMKHSFYIKICKEKGLIVDGF